MNIFYSPKHAEFANKLVRFCFIKVRVLRSIYTERKRKLSLMLVAYYRPQRSCEGYVFTRVCHSVHRGLVSQHALQVVSQYALQQGGLLPRGCACSRGGLLGGCLLRGEGVETPLKADGYCCGRYASYWNAFLFFDLF